MLLATQIYLRFYDPKAVIDWSEYEAFVEDWQQLDSLENGLTDQPASLFSFDPNTVSDSRMEALGLDARVRANIINYRLKGGFFSRPEDLLKIYGMDTLLYHRLADYISIEKRISEDRRHLRIQNQALKLRDTIDLNEISEKELSEIGLSEREVTGIMGYRNRYRPFQSPDDLLEVYNLDSAKARQIIPYVKLRKRRKDSVLANPLVVDLNHADSTGLLAIKGVGPYLAGKIIQYRNQLGAYAEMKQLLEIRGIDSLNYFDIRHQLKLDASQVKRININKASIQELENHPYIRRSVARNIVRFREEYRQFSSLEELKNLELVDEVLFSKIANYLCVEELNQK